MKTPTVIGRERWLDSVWPETRRRTEDEAAGWIWRFRKAVVRESIWNVVSLYSLRRRLVGRKVASWARRGRVRMEPSTGSFRGSGSDAGPGPEEGWENSKLNVLW